MKLFLIESNIEGLFNYYWSSTPILGFVGFAYYLDFDPYVHPSNNSYRYRGFPIRNTSMQSL